MDKLLTMIKLDLVEDIESATGILSYGSLQRGEVFMMTSGMLEPWGFSKKTITGIPVHDYRYAPISQEAFSLIKN